MIRRTEIHNEDRGKRSTELLSTTSAGIIRPVNSNTLQDLFNNTPSLNLEASYLFKNGLRNMQNNEYYDAFILIYISLEKFIRDKLGDAVNSIRKKRDEIFLIDLLKFVKNNFGYKLDIRGFEENGIFQEIRNDIVHGLGIYELNIITSQVKHLINSVLGIFTEFES